MWPVRVSFNPSIPAMKLPVWMGHPGIQFLEFVAKSLE
jgi:hypothetical protein